jgi:two-component system chemotaxis sensor kinase CheA
MGEYAFTEQELGELKDAFFAEAYEILHTLTEEVLRIEGGHDGSGPLKGLQRCLHTLKGNARALGYSSLNLLSHRAEDLLKTVQGKTSQPGQELVDLLFSIHDALKRYLDGYRANADVPFDDMVMTQIEAYIAAAGNGGEGGHGAPPDALMPEKGLLPIDGAVRDVEIGERNGGLASGEDIPTLRVEAQRVDKILNLVGELVIGRSMIGQVLSELLERYRKDDLVKRLGETNAFMEKALSQLQKNVMKIRMLPISRIFRKFPRVVRDLSLEKGKEINLVIRGEKTDLDKSILDAIGEPLLHLVRNAVDHGIEPPAERERKGKPRTGSVTLSASPEGNQIVIEVADDGAGIDPDRLRRKAVEAGIKTRDEADRLSDDEALNLIFLSGFSTAEKVTDISGRGLGMDIVRTIAESLKGRVSVQSEPGVGSSFTLRLPLTLAIIRAMLFSVGGRLLAFPMASVEKIVRIKDADVHSVSGKTVLRFRDRVISLFPLGELLTLPEDGAGRLPQKFVIVVGHNGAFSGFIVDRILGQQELVIKVLEDHWNTVRYTAGASILGNGQVVLIMDVPALVAAEKAQLEGAVS